MSGTQHVTLVQLFAEAGNTLKGTSKGVECGHEPNHVSKTGTCVKIDSVKGLWYCTSCQQGGDVAKAVQSLHGLSCEDAVAYVRTHSPDNEPGQKKRDSQATELVALANAATLWHTPDGDPWATIPVNGHHEHTGLRTKALRRWLVGQYYATHQIAPGGQGVQDALGILEAKAIHDGPSHPVYVCVAECEGRVYVDLATERWR
jgi:hypothetical protein